MISTYSPSCFYFTTVGLSNFLNFPAGTIYNVSPSTYPILGKAYRPADALCPICHDRLKFSGGFYFGGNFPYVKEPNPIIYKDDCTFCNGTGLHPLPLTDLYDELSYDPEDLP